MNGNTSKGLFENLDQHSSVYSYFYDVGSLAAVYHPFDDDGSNNPCRGQCFAGNGNPGGVIGQVWSGSNSSFGLFYWPTTDGYTLAGPDSNSGYFGTQIGSPNCCLPDG